MTFDGHIEWIMQTGWAGLATGVVCLAFLFFLYHKVTNNP